eukprot:12325906-Heterocapsa_arctica.AAC.1
MQFMREVLISSSIADCSKGEFISNVKHNGTNCAALSSTANCMHTVLLASMADLPTANQVG